MHSARNASIFCGVLALIWMSGKLVADPENKAQVPAGPFSVAVVPGSTGITMAQNNPDQFYAVLTNISEGPQPVWRRGSSWAYRNISFEFTTPDVRKFVLSEAPQEFTRNFPSTIVIEQGEHQVYAIRLDKWWESDSAFPKADAMSVIVKAIYEVHPTPEAVKYRVWTGRLESRSYNFALRQW